MNLGDEAILAVILRELRQRLPATFTVFSRNPRDTLARHGVERAVAVRQLSRVELSAEVGRLDLLITGGGGILFDGDAATFLRPAEAALAQGVPTMTWAVGAGPLTGAEERECVRRTLERMDLVTVRDTASRLLLEETGVHREIHLTADPGLLLEPEPFTGAMLAREGLGEDMRLIGLSVREVGPAAPDLGGHPYHQLLADAVDFLTERTGAVVVFIPMEDADFVEAHRVAAYVRNARRVRLLTGDYSPGQIRGLMAHLDFAIGMRLHFLIFAARAGVPLVALPYGTKVSQFIEELELTRLRLQSTTPGQLLATVDRAWDERDVARERHQARTRGLAERARQTIELTLQLLHVPRVQRAEEGLQHA
jgi:polysaccharide pyruvyl transferase CsaB